MSLRVLPILSVALGSFALCGCTLVVDADRYVAPFCHWTLTGDVSGSGDCHQFLCRIDTEDSIDILTYTDTEPAWSLQAATPLPMRWDVGTYTLNELELVSLTVRSGARTFVARQRSTPEETLTIDVRAIRVVPESCSTTLDATIESDLVEPDGIGRAHLTIELGL